MRNPSANPRLTTKIVTTLLLAVGFSPAFAAAQAGPIGPDLRAGSDPLATCPSVAMGAGGDFAVVWNHYYSDSHRIPQGVFVRHFDSQGRPSQAAQIQLDAPDSIESNSAQVVALPDSGYFVTWWEFRARGALVGRFLGPEGRPRGPVLRLRRGGALPVGLAVVSDSLLVVWREGPYLGEVLQAQRFDFDGHALGKPVLITNRRGIGAVGLAPLADSFVVGWERWTGKPGKSWVIEAQRFSLAGEPLGDVVRGAARRFGGQNRVEVASDGNDRFAVAWTVRGLHSDPQTGQPVTDDETRARFFDASGASSPEAHPNRLSAGNQQATGLAMNDRAFALVTWHSDRDRRSSQDVVGRFLAPDGQPASEAFPIAQNLTGNDICPAAATSGGAEWVVAWLKQNENVVARRLTFAAE